MTDIAQAVLALDSNAQVSVNADDIAQITWYDGNPRKITAEKILAKQKELQAAEPLRLLRVERDRLLAESDWWGSSDLTMSAKRKSYRQALRDLPKGLTTEELVKNVTWPTKPA